MSPETSPIFDQASQFNSTQGFLILSFSDNFCEFEINRIEAELLARLAQDKAIQGVLLDFGLVCTTDVSDLHRLQDLLRAIRLLGRKLLVSGITPGLAALIVQSGISLHHEVAGYDIDDALSRFRSCATGF